MLKNPKLFILPLFVFVFMVFANTPLVVAAQEDVGGIGCDPSKFVFKKYQDSFVVSILSTTLLHSAGLTDVKPFFLTYGASPAEVMGCGSYIVKEGKMEGTELGKALLAQNCEETDEDVCRGITNQFQFGGGTKDVIGSRNYDSKSFANNKIAGSLLGYAYFIENTTTYEPVPVNTAYFFRDYAAKLPIIGDSVYAANEIKYGHSLIDSVLGIWKIFRNIAYAMMSLIMLWVGFAIITRKKISSQTVVNVQYAMPKIIIALVMIAFSYPIGATITSFSWTLWHSALLIIKSIGATSDFAENAETVSNVGIGGLNMLIQSVIIGVSGAGTMIVLLALMGLAVIIFSIFANIKALWIYLKMVISIATAPIQIALYALPGQDDKLEMWLKQMIAWGVGLFGMAMVNWLTLTWAAGLIMQSFSSSGGAWETSGGIVSGSLFNVFIAPLLVIFGFSTSIKVPNMVEEMIMDKKPGRK